MPSASPPVVGEDPPFAPTLIAARTGALWALRQIYRHHAPQVVGYLGLRGVPNVDAAAKRVFLRAMRKLASFEGDEADFRAWLFTLARRQVAEELGGLSTQALKPGDGSPGVATEPVPPVVAPWPWLSRAAPARLRSLVGAHPVRALAVVTLGVVGVLAATGAPPFQRSASNPRVSSVDISPSLPPGASVPAGDARQRPGATMPDPASAPGSTPCPEPAGGPSTSSAITPAGKAECEPSRSTTTTRAAVTPTTATTAAPSTSTTTHPPTTEDAPSTTTSEPRRRSSF